MNNNVFKYNAGNVETQETGESIEETKGSVWKWSCKKWTVGTGLTTVFIQTHIFELKMNLITCISQTIIFSFCLILLSKKFYVNLLNCVRNDASQLDTFVIFETYLMYCVWQ